MNKQGYPADLVAVLTRLWAILEHIPADNYHDKRNRTKVLCRLHQPMKYTIAELSADCEYLYGMYSPQNIARGLYGLQL
jgi:hypothetical protein